MQLLNYLTIQGSSVPYELLFPSAGLVYTKWQNHLSPETFENIELLTSLYSECCIMSN